MDCMNAREAQESGRRLKAQVAPETVKAATRLARKNDRSTPRSVAGQDEAPLPTVTFNLQKTEPRLGSIVIGSRLAEEKRGRGPKTCGDPRGRCGRLQPARRRR